MDEDWVVDDSVEGYKNGIPETSWSEIERLFRDYLSPWDQLNAYFTKVGLISRFFPFGFKISLHPLGWRLKGVFFWALGPNKDLPIENIQLLFQKDPRWKFFQYEDTGFGEMMPEQFRHMLLDVEFRQAVLTFCGDDAWRRLEARSLSPHSSDVTYQEFVEVVSDFSSIRQRIRSF